MDIPLYVVSVLSIFMNCAKESHFKAAKRVLRYVKETLNYGMKFNQLQDFKLQGYFDSDWAWPLDDMKNTSGYCNFLFFFSFYKVLLFSVYKYVYIMTDSIIDKCNE